MKKILIGIFAVLICFTLVGCGKKNEDIKVENKVNLSIDKNVYTKEERIEVSLDFGKTNKDSAVIVITESSTKHENEKYVHDEKNYTEYRYLADFSEIPFYMWAPNKDGKYDVRVYENNDGGKELASVSFEVNATLSSDTSWKDDKKEEDNANKTTGCKKINQEHMAHFGIAGFDVDSSYCIYEYDYRDYIDTLRIFYVADETEQIRAAQDIFSKSGSYESLDDGKQISSIEDSKYFMDGSYRFVNETYVYTVKLQKEAEEENPFNDISVKANTIIIDIQTREL